MNLKYSVSLIVYKIIYLVKLDTVQTQYYGANKIFL